MLRFKHLLLDLALDGQDSALLHWAEHIAELSGSRQITVLHSWETNDIPARVKEKYPWLVAPGKEVLQEKMEKLIATELSEKWQGRVELNLVEGERIKTVLKKARDVSADLVITARCTREDTTEKHSARIARKSPCSVLCVEVSKPASYEDILVPVDFSEHSKHAFDFGCALARAAGIGEISILRSFGIPYGQHKATISREEFAAEYENFENEHLAKFIEEEKPVDVRIKPVVIESMVAAYGIANHAKSHGVDIIVLGSRGAHAVSALLLGSTTEEVINQVLCSILVIKPKGTGLSLLDSLLGD